MPLTSFPPAVPSEAAVLLVLVPPVPFGELPPDGLSTAAIRALQARLGSAIRVLRIDEGSHPAVVRSFGTPVLPACVLLHHGVELWRQQGLPKDESFVINLLNAARTA